MTLQDFFPADLTLLGLQKLYSQLDMNSFLVNSPSVLAKDKILKKQKKYILFTTSTKSNTKISEIVLIDVFVYQGMVHLISEDFATHKLSNVSLPLKCPDSNCTRYLVDINYFTDLLDAKAIQNYCGRNCSIKKPLSEVNTIYSEDLLEFDYSQ